MPQVVEVPGIGDVEFPDGMSDAQIAAAIRKNIPPTPAPSSPSLPAGWSPNQYPPGFTPPLPGISNPLTSLNEAAGVTSEANPTDAVTMIPEVALQTGTGLLGASAGGLAGILQGGWNSLAPDSMRGPDAADRVRQVQEAMTYQPRTAGGQALSTVASLPGRAVSAGTTYLGEKTTDVTGSPLLGAAVKTVGDAVGPVTAARALKNSIKSAPKSLEKFVDTKNAVPTTEQLTKASREAYAAGKESGVIVPKEGYAEALGSVRKMVKEEGIDPTLHPKSMAVVKRLDEAAGKPLTLQEAETLRKIALDAEDDLNPVTRAPTPDSRLAGKIVDELDERIDALSVNSPARELWSRSRRSQMVDQMIHRAEIRAGAHYTQAGMEHALRQEFKQLAMNPRRLRGLTKDQKAAIEKVAKGGKLENTLRALGKFDPTTSAVSAVSSLGTSALLSAAVNPAAGLLPLVGIASKRAATKATSRNVDNAREALVGRGMSTGGLLAKDNPTPLLETAQGLLSPPRPARQIRADIQALTAEVNRLASMGPQAATVRGSVESELARLRQELTAAEARGGSP